MSSQEKQISCYNDSFRVSLPDPSSPPLFEDISTTLSMNPVVVDTIAAFCKALDSGEIELEIITHSPFGGKPLLPLSTIDRFALPFGSWLCPDTGIIVTSPRIKESSLPKYYEKYYHPMNYGKKDMSMQQSLFASGQGAKIWNLVRPHLKTESQKCFEVLEIGAGLGDVLHGLQHQAREDGIELSVMGTEYNLQCINVAKNSGVHMISGGFDEALSLNKRYDIVILSHVFEHLTDLSGSMEKLHHLLAPEGVLYIEVPGLMALNRRPVYDFNFVRYSIHAHTYSFNLTAIEHILRQGGFHLLSGNEECEAVFNATSKNENSFALPIEGNAQLVYSYLHRRKQDAAQYQALANEYHKYRKGHSSCKHYQAVCLHQNMLLSSRWHLFRLLVRSFLPQFLKSGN